MSPAPDVLSDPVRLDALRRTKLLDSESEEALDQLVRVAARLLQAPLALISLVDEHRQYFKSCVGGLPEPWHRTSETPLSYSLCQYAVMSAAPLIIGDTQQDPVVSENKAVTELGVAAYAGIPLIVERHAIGTLCVLDSKPREWTDEQIDTLKSLAGAVASALSFRSSQPNTGPVDNVAPALQASTSTSARQHEPVANALLASVTRYIEALDEYDLSLEETLDMGSLGREAHLQQAILTAEQGLKTETRAFRQQLGSDEIPSGQESEPVRDLLEASESYLAALRKRQEASTAFQQSEISLEQVERQALLAREAEQTLRLVHRAYTLKLG